MGVCCSKSSSVSIKEQVGPTKETLVPEVIGPTGSKADGVNINASSSNLPVIENTQEIPIQEAESINTYNNEKNSAARSTLIFPSYSGYRSNEQFQVQKKPLGSDLAPTAFVSPYQTSRTSPYGSRNTINFVAQRTSPLLSRYSPQTTPRSLGRTRPSAFATRLTSPRRGSVESRGFDSDLESESEEINLPNAIPVAEEDNNDSNNNITVTEVAPTTPVKTEETSTNTTPKHVSNSSVGTETTDENYVTTVDACVGTNSEEFYRSKKSTKMQVDLKNKKDISTCSMAVGTESDPILLSTKSINTIGIETTDIDSSLDSRPSKKTSISTSTQDEILVKVVDACVGTDSDEFYRSSKEATIQVNIKNKKAKTSSKETATDNRNSSPHLLKTPKVKKISITKISPPEPVARRRPSATPSLTQSSRRSSAKPEPNPIIETLENAFIRFARYGDINNEGLEMNNKNWAKLCRDCEFIDHKGVLVGDVDVIFSRHKPKGYRLIDFDMFLNCLNEIADRKFSNKIKDEWTRREIIYKNVIGKAPELLGVTGTSKTGNVDRMTDHNLYPVSHKMRFDDDGRGLGIEEKFEIQDSQMGYVQGYKDRDTYELKMMGLTKEKSNLSNNVRFPSPRAPPGHRSSTTNRNLTVN